MGLEIEDRLNLLRHLGRTLARARTTPDKVIQSIILKNDCTRDAFLEGAEMGQREKLEEEEKKNKPK
jgi:hypothetical protein